MAGISIGGLGSGLDINGLVRQLVDAERLPALNRIRSQESRVDARLSAFGSLKTAVDNFKTALADLGKVGAFSGRSVSSAQPDRLTATALSSAVPGQYSVTVEALARTHKIASAGFATAGSVVGSGELSLSNGQGDSLSITVPPGSDSLTAIRDAINNAPGNTVASASIVKSDDGFHLVLTAKQGGLAGQLSLNVVTDGSDSGDLSRLVFDPQAGSNPMTQQVAAQNARLMVDGFVRESASNTISDMVPGVTFNLLKAVPGESFDLTVGLDDAGSKAAIEKFVSAYNDLNGRLNTLTAFNPSTKVGAVLQGDATVNRLQAALRSEVGRLMSGAGDSLRLMSDFGVSTEVNGNLRIDAARLDSALATRFDQVAGFFTASGGLKERLSSIIDSYVGSNGLIDARTEGLRAQKREFDKQRDALDVRVASIERRFRAQFSNLDSLISSMNNTSQFLSAQLTRLL